MMQVLKVPIGMSEPCAFWLPYVTVAECHLGGMQRGGGAPRTMVLGIQSRGRGSKLEESGKLRQRRVGSLGWRRWPGCNRAEKEAEKNLLLWFGLFSLCFCSAF